MSTATSTVTHTATGTVAALSPQTLGQSIPVAVPALRFLTAGSVDDGKSTLIGRLLLDSKSILADQLAGLKNSSHGAAEMDLARLTDGLQAEREQGITIDVAYRYFATPQRKFIIADAPGHEQYTRNMVTAASSSDAAVVLLNNGHLGMIRQMQRHYWNARFSAELLGANPDFVEVAKGFRCRGIHVERPDEIREAIREALDSPVTTVVEIMVDPDEDILPMLPMNPKIPIIKGDCHF